MKISILIAMVVGSMALVVGCSDHGHGHGEGADHDHAIADKTPEVEAPKVAEKPPEPDFAKAADPAEVKPPMAFDEKPAVGTKATCPVMKGEFVVSENSDRSEFEGKHYAFCCPGCKPQFDADPKKFIDG